MISNNVCRERRNQTGYVFLLRKLPPANQDCFCVLCVLAVCLFPWPLAEGCSIYSPQKVRQSGSEYKRLIEMEERVREKCKMWNSPSSRPKVVTSQTSLCSCLSLRGAPDAFLHVWQQKKMSLSMLTYVTPSGPPVWCSSRFKQTLIIIHNNRFPLPTLGHGWLTLMDCSSGEALFSSPKTREGEFQESDTHIPPSNTW